MASCIIRSPPRCRSRRPPSAQILPEVRTRLGPRLDLGKPIVGTVFPNFSMLRPTSRAIRVWHPNFGSSEV
jgi:hypothetical protein